MPKQNTAASETLKERIALATCHKDAQGKPTHERQLTDSQRQWYTVAELTQLVNQSKESGTQNVTTLQVSNAVLALVHEGRLKGRLRSGSDLEEFAAAI